MLLSGSATLHAGDEEWHARAGTLVRVGPGREARDRARLPRARGCSHWAPDARGRRTSRGGERRCDGSRRVLHVGALSARRASSRRAMTVKPLRDVSPEGEDGEERLEQSLRPATFEEYVGQEKLVENFSVYAKAARARGEALDHVLLSGPPGLGKTSLAHILARELGVTLHVTSGPALVKKGDLAGLLTALAPRDILFIDEIHRLSPAVEEALYPAMEDFRFDVVLGGGPRRADDGDEARARSRSSARRRAPGCSPRPLRDRFPHPGAARVLRARRSSREIAVRAAREARAPGRARRRRGARAPRARHAPHRDPAAAARPRLRAGRGRRPAHARDRGHARSRASRWTRAGSTRWTGASSRSSSTRSAAGRSASTPSPPRWARSATRSRTCTSRSSCARGSSRARRAAAWRCRAAYAAPRAREAAAGKQGSLV